MKKYQWELGNVWKQKTTAHMTWGFDSKCLMGGC